MFMSPTIISEIWGCFLVQVIFVEHGTHFHCLQNWHRWQLTHSELYFYNYAKIFVMSGFILPQLVSLFLFTWSEISSTVFIQNSSRMALVFDTASNWRQMLLQRFIWLFCSDLLHFHGYLYTLIIFFQLSDLGRILFLMPCR